MIKLQINRLKINLQTNEGKYGTDISFKPGLNIIRADNTFGKSTCIQSIIFALGLEGTLGPSRKTPLKSALTTRLNKDSGGQVLVSESDIFLEIANQQGKAISLHRNASTEKQRIISVYDNTISEVESGLNILKSDYFVREHGSAAREKGFHFFLEQFLGITEPQVIKYDGTFSPLYLESIFAVNYVEQTRGWGGILNVLPTYLSIKDISNKILEYTLDLDIQENNRKRQLLNKKKSDLESIWRVNVEKLIAVAKNANAFVQTTLSDELNKNSFIDSASDIYVLLENSTKQSSNERLENLKRSLNSMKAEQHSSERTNQKSAELEKELSLQIQKLNSEETAASILIGDINTSESYIDSIHKRTSALNESLRKYRDIKKLQEYGSTEKLSLSRKVCPTCSQPIEDSLLPHMHNQAPLGVEDNIKYLEKQKIVFESMSSAEASKLMHKKSLVNVMQKKIAATRGEIRNLKEGLLEINGFPSRIQIRKELMLEESILQLEKALALENEVKDKLQATLIEWKTIVGSMEKLPWDGFSWNDNIKFKALAETFKSNLADFEYKSTEIDKFEISKRTYKPAIDDIDLGSEASASDNIRVIWAYMYSLLILDTTLPKISTNHLGILILDEPRQQETKEVNFKTFIEKAAKSASLGKQIIIATSEKSEDLSSMIRNLDVNVKSFESPLISKMV